MRLDYRLALLIFPAILVLFGCSSGSAPISPDTTGQSLEEETPYIPVGSDSGNRFFWAYHEIIFGPEDDDVEIVPMRQVADHWNVLRWLEQTPCTNCFRITGLTPTPKGTLQVFVEIRHPFPVANLTGFDVRGIAMSHGSYTFPVSGLLTTQRAFGEGELVNADGYTTLYNINTFGAGPGGLQGYIQGSRATIPYPNTTLNGYKRHISSDPGNTRNAFFAGTAVTQVYEIFKPAGPFILGYAVDACWAPPTTTPVVDPMNDFPPEANCTEPWKLDLSATPVGLGLTYEGGEVVLAIDVYDYQGKLSHYAPAIECPQLFNGVRYASYKSSGTGYATFEITIENEELAPNGLYKCLIVVEDIENSGSPPYINLTAYHIIELGVGEQAPQNVTGFKVSDADPDLPNRRVELIWNPGDDTVEWYDIERLDYDLATGWFWNQVKTAAHPDTSWIDGNPRYCGPANPIQYRISARNAAGSSPGYSTDTGYPLMRGFNIALWCAADDGGGSNPSTSWNRAFSDFNNCNTFWNAYGMNFVPQNSGAFFWVGNPAYKNVTGDEAGAMQASYGAVHHPESVNVYYVDSADGDTGMAYCLAMCPEEFHNTENIAVIMARDSSVPQLPVTLAHEMGHAIGRFWDVYLLDTDGDLMLDDGTSCAVTNTWCNTLPYNDPLFCDVRACYALNPGAENKNPWNLMWYSYPGKPLSNYNLYDSQYVWLHDWVNSHKSNYPWP